MFIVNIIILSVLSISLFVFPKINTKLQLNIYLTLQISLITTIFTMGSYFIEIMENKIEESTELVIISVLLALVIGLSNNKFYKKFGVK